MEGRDKASDQIVEWERNNTVKYILNIRSKLYFCITFWYFLCINLTLCYVVPVVFLFLKFTFIRKLYLICDLMFQFVINNLKKHEIF